MECNMKFIYCGDSSEEENINLLNESIDNGDHVFVLIYMNGCVPCEMTKPRWIGAIEDHIDEDAKRRSDITVAAVESQFSSNIHSIGEIGGYPTMKYISKTIVEPYEESNILIKDRSTKSFINWIHSKCGTNKKPKSSKRTKKLKLSKNTKTRKSSKGKSKRKRNLKKNRRGKKRTRRVRKVKT